MFEYRNLLSTYQFRKGVGAACNGVKFFSVDDANTDVRGLYRDAIRVARENGIDIVDDGLCAVRLNDAGWIVDATADDLEHNAAAARRVLDLMRASHIDLQECLGGTHSLAGFVLDAPSWACTIDADAKLVRCRWRENWSV